MPAGHDPCAQIKATGGSARRSIERLEGIQRLKRVAQTIAQARCGEIEKGAGFHGQAALSGMDQAHRERRRFAVDQQPYEPSRTQRVGHLIRQHARNAEAAFGSIDNALSSRNGKTHVHVDAAFSAALRCSGRARRVGRTRHADRRTRGGTGAHPRRLTNAGPMAGESPANRTPPGRSMRRLFLADRSIWMRRRRVMPKPQPLSAPMPKESRFKHAGFGRGEHQILRPSSREQRHATGTRPRASTISA